MQMTNSITALHCFSLSLVTLFSGAIGVCTTEKFYATSTCTREVWTPPATREILPLWPKLSRQAQTKAGMHHTILGGAHTHTHTHTHTPHHTSPPPSLYPPSLYPLHSSILLILLPLPSPPLPSPPLLQPVGPAIPLTATFRHQLATAGVGVGPGAGPGLEISIPPSVLGQMAGQQSTHQLAKSDVS